MMKRRALILVSFLMVLMIPMSFGNVAAVAYDYSPESIAEFNETLPSDVLFYSDAILGDAVLASSGDDDYTDSFTVNGVTWAADDDPHEHAEFLLGVGYGSIETFSYSLYAYGYNGEGYFEIWNGTSWVLLETILETAAVFSWYNGTIDMPSVGSIVTVGIYGDGIFGDCAADYLEIRAFYMTGANDATQVQSEPHFATGGDTGFANTYAVDASNFSVDGVLEFSYTASNISSLVSFNYAIYGVSAGSTFVHYSNDDVDYGTGAFDVITSEGWYNGTYNTALGALENTGTGYVQFFSNHESSVNYMEISFTYIPVSGYGESFSDVSDWVVTQGTMTTDGDIANITRTSGSYAYAIYTLDSERDFSGYYLEFSVAAGIEDYFIQLRNIGDTQLYTTGAQSGIGVFKEIITSAIATAKIWVFVDDTEAVGDEWVQFDYLRISTSDEMGWQHDASTLEGLTFAGTNSTDGDTITLTATGATQAGYFITDTTATVSGISSAYYPFLEFNVTSTTSADSDCWLARVYDTDGNYNNIPPTEAAYVNLTGVFRVNLEALPALNGYPSKVLFYLQDSGDSITIDYVKFYSIADFSYVAGGGESTNDYSYVEDGELIVNTDTYTNWNYDPTLSVTIATYGLWSASITNGSDAFRFRELQDTSTLWDQGITNGSLVGTTLEDFDILIYGNCTISSINFYGIVPAWNIITTVEIVFWVAGWHIISSIVILFVTELSTYALNLFLLFFGLVMIPTSSIYLVKGGRDEMSTDKLFFAIVIFILGWAFFLGGIFV